MKKYFLIVIITAIGLFGCEKRKFTQVVSFDIKRTFTEEFQGTKQVGPMSIDRGDVLALAGLPDDARVKDVNIQGIGLKVRENEELSKAWSVKVEGFLVTPNSMPQIWPAISVPLAGATFTAVNKFIGKNVQLITTELVKMLKNEEDTRSVRLELKLTSSDPVAIDMDVKIQVSITYEFCREVATILGEDGEECDL